MSRSHEGYANVKQYRASISRFGLPYVVVTALAFFASLLGNEDANWVTYSLGWTVALSSLAFSYLRPRFWIVAPFGALVGALLVRSATEGLDAGLGPLLMIPAIAVAVYGSRQALIAMIASITAIVIGIEVLVAEDAAFSPAWRQDAILVVLATVLAIAIQDLVTRMRTERALAAARGRQIEQLNEITKAMATSTDGGSTLCEITTQVTEAVGAALFKLDDEGEPVPIASSGGRNEMLRQVAAGPTLAPHTLLQTGNRVTVREADSELNLQRMAWHASPVSSVVWEPAFLNGSVVGMLALVFGPGWTDDEDSVISIDVLAAEGTIAIQQRRVTEQLENLATTDPLTEIDNRRGWERAIEPAVSRAKRMKQPLCIALLDLDHFKLYHDSHGHQAGDTFLQACALAWKNQMRADDHIARYGGEEFIVTLPNTDIQEALEVVERLRTAVPDGETSSAGVARWNGEESLPELVSRADKALYLAKENGRNVAIAAASNEAELA